MTLRPYQQEAKNKIREAFHNRNLKSALVVMATGLGKRLLSIDIAKHFKKVLFIAHREELIEQAFNEFEQYHTFQTGIIKGSRFEIDKKFIVASAQTLYRRLDKIPKDTFDHIIVDEAHFFAAKTFLEPLHYFTPRLLLGYTATPYRLDGLSLSNIFEEKICDYDIEYGVKNGFLAKPEAYKIRTQTDLSEVKKLGGDFNIGQLSEAVDTEIRNELIVSKYCEMSKGEQALCFAVDIKHAINIKNKFIEHNISSEVIVSDEIICSNRKELITNFKNGKIQVLVNVDILTTGFDYSDIGVIIQARPTQSKTLFVQQIGRGTRLKSQAFQKRFDHNTCIILDFVDNTKKNNLINCEELDRGKPLEKRVFTNKNDMAKLLEAREKRKIFVSNEVDMKINLFALPEVSISNSERMLEQATEKQISFLKSLNIWTEGVEYTKRQASEFISNTPAQSWQLQKLRNWGYNITDGASIGQFQKVKQKLESDSKYKIDKIM